MAKAEAEAITLRKTAEAKMLNNTIFFETKAYKEAGTILGTTVSSGLLDYIYYLNVMKLSDTQLLVGLENSLINIHPNTGKRNLDDYFEKGQTQTGRNLDDL